MKPYLVAICLFYMGLGTASFVKAQEAELPQGFVYIHELIPDIQYDIRYFSSYNFIGKPIDGYEKGVAILSEPAALALQKVQAELKEKGLGLLVYDAYRPQTAVNHFIRWAKQPEDTLMKAAFYPEVPKSRLFELGYIAARSGHSRGSTIDLSVLDLSTGEPLDMGGTFDFFGSISHQGAQGITRAQEANRRILKDAMMKQGFEPNPKEWWHFNLAPEPYPDTYFDFPVQ